MAKYKWRDGMPKPKISADAFGRFAEKLGGGNVEAVTPNQVVEAARNSPIRALFNWDDKKAAHAHRLQQARTYLGGLQIAHVKIGAGPSHSVHAYHVAHIDGGRGYVHHDRIMADSTLRAEVIANAKSRLESFINSFASAAALGAYIPRLREIVDAMRAEIDEIQAAATAGKTKRRSNGSAHQETRDAA